MKKETLVIIKIQGSEKQNEVEKFLSSQSVSEKNRSDQYKEMSSLQLNYHLHICYLSNHDIRVEMLLSNRFSLLFILAKDGSGNQSTCVYGAILNMIRNN